MKKNILIFLFSIIGIQSIAQNVRWVKKEFNNILVLNLPAHFNYTHELYAKGYEGYINKDFFGFQYLDTIMMQITNEKQFQISLDGFITGMMIRDTSLKNYNMSVTDTSIGRTKGIMAKFETENYSIKYKRIYYYITLINSRYYWFYAYSPFIKSTGANFKMFFKSIMFDSKKVIENSFVTHAVSE